MDRQQVIGLVLITVIFIGWFYWSYEQQKDYVSQIPVARPDSSMAVEQKPEPAATASRLDVESKADSGRFVPVTGPHAVTIRTPDYTAILSRVGARLTSFKVNHYLENGQPAELLPEGSGHGLNYLLQEANGSQLSTQSIDFQVSGNDSLYQLNQPTDSVTIRYEAKTKAGEIIGIVYRFYGTGFKIGHQLYLSGWQNTLAAQQVQLQWKDGLRLTEPDKTVEASSAEAMFRADEDNDYLNATATDADEELIYPKIFNWSSIRTKYFAVAILNTDQKAGSVKLSGRTYKDKAGHPEEKYTMVQFFPYQRESYFSKTSTIFLTPLDYYYLKGLDLELHNIMSLGLPYLVKPISEYFILPLFIFLHDWIPSWGLVIIVFTILIKILLYPLTESQTAGFKKMAEVAPKMKEIQDKFANDKERMQQEMLKLYREHGYNPLGGCLPLLLQMPILFALYTVFANAIEFRQAEFLWVSDLSLPDVLVPLPFHIPIYGAHISLFALLVAGSQIWQMKLQPQTNKEQAAIMMWVFPIMMLLIFNNLSSGLNMYYFLFNLLTIAQTWFFNRRESSLLASGASDKKIG